MHNLIYTDIYHAIAFLCQSSFSVRMKCLIIWLSQSKLGILRQSKYVTVICENSIFSMECVAFFWQMQS